MNISAAMKQAIVVFNSGSTSLKFGAYGVDSALDSSADPAALSLLCVGRIDSITGDPHFVVKDAAAKTLATHDWGEGYPIDHAAALQHVIRWLAAYLSGTTIVAAGHRVVLGGTRYDAPVRIDAEVLQYLDSLVAMEPSHQRFNIAGARAFAKAFPGVPQVACFDNAFHRTMPEVAQTYALPKEVRNAGVRHCLGLRRAPRIHRFVVTPQGRLMHR